MSKILITGASGFVGSHISSELAKNNTIFAISRGVLSNSFEKVFSWKNYNDEPCDYDVVIHLAGLAHDTSNSKEEEEYFIINRDLTASLVKWINESKNSVKLIYLSSIKVYDESTLIDEKSVKGPKSIYGKSKLAAENMIIEDLYDNHRYYILEPSMIYGIGNKGNLPKLFYLLLRGVPFPFGRWENKRSILAIENLGFIITQLIKKNLSSDFFVVSDDEPISTATMVNELFKNTNTSYIRLSLPSFLVRFIIWFSSKLGVNTYEKLLGNLEVNNKKIKDALNINKLPYDVRTSLNLLGRQMELNK